LATLALAALIAGALRALFDVRRRWAFAGAVVVALNCNLLNAWYQGAYGQTWVATLALLAVVTVLLIRDAGGTPWSRDITRAVGVIALAVAGILPAYADVATAFAVVLLVTVVWDLLSGGWRPAAAIAARVAVGGAAAVLLVLPFAVEFLRYAPARYKNASANGFFQPHWATPGEILGLSDMYEQPGHGLIPTTLGSMRVLIALSLLVGVLVYWSLKRLKPRERRVFLVLIGFTAVVFYRTRFEDPSSNYRYYKIYTYLTPAMLLLLLGGLVARGVDRVDLRPLNLSGRRIRRPPPTWVLAVVVAIVGFVGIQSITTMRSQSRFVTPLMLDLASDPVAQRVLSGTAIVIPPSPALNDQLAAYMMAALVNLNWVNRGDNVIVTARPRMPVAVAIIEGQEGACLPCVRRDHRGLVLLDRRSILLVSTKATLGDVTDPVARQLSQARLRGALSRAGARDLTELFAGTRVDPY